MAVADGYLAVGAAGGADDGRLERVGAARAEGGGGAADDAVRDERAAVGILDGDLDGA